ncbi:MAG: DUF4499 domain-containing protein [Actinomycetota bacterium]
MGNNEVMKLGDIDRPAWWYFAGLDGALLALGLLACIPSWAAQVRDSLWLPSQGLLIGLFIAALLVHLGEALFAYSRAKAAELPAFAWALQTFVVGFPSLRKLLAQEA